MSHKTVSFENLLDSLGFDEWKTFTLSFILPAVNVLGITFCSLSGFIFFSRKFVDPVFFYYRLLCLVYITHLIHNIPAGVLCSPRYFPQMNTHLSSMYLIYYIIVTSTLFQFEYVLLISILLTRMKLFDVFVEKNFTFSPRLVSLTLFLICICINLPLAFGLKIRSFGTYLDSTQQHNITFYYFDSSEFSLTLFGQILFGFTTLFLNLIFSMFLGIGLNVFSLLKYKAYLREKRLKICRLIQRSINNRQTTSLEIQQFNERMNSDCDKEKSMFNMVLTLCSLSIVSRIFKIFAYFYFFFFFPENSLSSILNIEIVHLFIESLVPTVALFVFFSFNKMFRQEIKCLFVRKSS